MRDPYYHTVQAKTKPNLKLSILPSCRETHEK